MIFETVDGKYIDGHASLEYTVYSPHALRAPAWQYTYLLADGRSLCTNDIDLLVFTTPLKELKGCVTTGKLRYDLIPPQVLKDIAEVFTDGSIKYPDESWKTYSLDKNMQSLLRHLAEYRLGNTYDDESGSHNLAHLATRVIFQLYLEEYNTYPLEDRDD